MAWNCVRVSRVIVAGDQTERFPQRARTVSGLI